MDQAKLARMQASVRIGMFYSFFFLSLHIVGGKRVAAGEGNEMDRLGAWIEGVADRW